MNLSLDVRTRLLVSVALGLLGAALAAHVYAGLTGGRAPDFDQQWLAARALLHGKDPYVAVPAAGFLGPYYYPLPAAVVALPFGFLPLGAARLLFAGLSVAVLAFALSSRGWWPLLWFASGPALTCMIDGQWALLLAAAVLLPPLRFLWAVKPTLGLPLWVGWPGKGAVLGAAALVALSLVIQPAWPGEWLEAARHSTIYLAPIQRPGGFLLLLAFLRWRQPAGRFLGTLALIPHTEALYDLVTLGLIPRSRKEMLLLASLGLVALVLDPVSRTDLWLPIMEQMWPWHLVLVYLPALLLVLRHPNHQETLPPPAAPAG